jgi:hypothetical protein
MSEEQRVVSPEEVLRRKDDHAFVSQQKVQGTAVIRDKDGNIKGEMQITSLDSIDVNEDEEKSNADN